MPSLEAGHFMLTAKGSPPSPTNSSLDNIAVLLSVFPGQCLSSREILLSHCTSSFK